MERLADPSRLAGLDENDPASMARWMKSMSREMGEDIDVDAMMDEAMTEQGGADEDHALADSDTGRDDF